MVTTVTPSWARFVGGEASLSPVAGAPPWIHTMTGLCRRSGCRLVVNTFRNRQFSDVLAWPNGDAAWGQCGPNCVASRTPFQRAAGCGARQRSAPTGGGGDGRAGKSPIAPFASPRTAPSLVPTTGPLPPACSRIGLALTAGAAATKEPRMTPATASQVRARHLILVIDLASPLQPNRLTLAAVPQY